MHRPQDGITVATIEQAMAAPFCPWRLADLGARGTKIELPGLRDFAQLGYDAGTMRAGMPSESFRQRQALHR